MEMIKPIPASFKDPDGFIFNHNNTLYRLVTDNYQESYRHFMDSGLYQELIDKNLLIAHTEVASPVTNDIHAFKILLPEQISFISYPYEWGFDQWKEVLLNFLTINRIALQYGMILKDATPFNFTFYKGKPLFIDSLSFIIYKEGDPWIAYRQFCESMLGPFALIKYNGPNWVKQFSSFIDGIQLSYISKELPFSSRFNMTVMIHIHLHASYEGKEGYGAAAYSVFDKQKLNELFLLIAGSLQKWKHPVVKKAHWITYYDEQVISKEYLAEKEMLIDEWLIDLAGNRLTDLGANNGKFSLIAAKYFKEVIAVESDADCIDDLYNQFAKSNITNITAVLADLMQPSPGLGWNNAEREPLLKRLRADTVLGLALIHHLCIVHNLPLRYFASFISSVTNQYAIIEFIPKSDPMVSHMLQAREDIFHLYTEEEFRKCFDEYFTLVKVQQPARVNRSVYLWQKK